MKHIRLTPKSLAAILLAGVIGCLAIFTSPPASAAVSGNVVCKDKTIVSIAGPVTDDTKDQFYNDACKGRGGYDAAATQTQQQSQNNSNDQITCNILPQDICNKAKAGPTSGGAEGTAIYDLLVWVLKVLTALVGVAAVGALVYAGILYSSASNDNAQVSKAKTVIRDTVVGIVVYGFMFLILNWLIPGGVLG